MASDIDPEILDDFLAEAGELLDALNEELIELESRPDDLALLNKAFRAFHTIKGGAGFIGLTELVRICHLAEEVMSELRNGAMTLTPTIMDALLQSLDAVNQQFAACRDGLPAPPAPETLLVRLVDIVERREPAELPTVDEDVAPAIDPLEAEFEQMLDALHGAKPAAGAPEPLSATGDAGADEEPIGLEDDEFEALIDQFQAARAPLPPVAEIPETPTVSREPAAVPTPQITQPPARAVAAAVPAELRDRKDAGTVRIDVARLDAIMNLVGELVLVRNRINALKRVGKNPEFSAAADNLDRVTGDIQAAVMESRLQPIKKLFSRFPRLVRDLARDVGKAVDLQLVGEDTELDRKILDALSEPLVHLVRNAVDHGLEPPEQRAKTAKPAQGLIEIGARYASDRVEIWVREDGRGLDAAVISQKAVQKGLITASQAAAMTESQIHELIFLPGFSTSETVSNISGRGVGMDAVRSTISELNGRIQIESERGAGSKFVISVPLTLAIMPTLMVVLGGQRFALPLEVVQEVCELDDSNVRVLDSQVMLKVRESAIPVCAAADLLGMPAVVRENSPDLPQVVVVQVGSRSLGLVVDEILGQEEVVLKPLGAYVRALPGLAAGTITGDGKIALILDVPELLKRVPPLFVMPQPGVSA